MYDAARRRRNITDPKPTSPHRQQSGADQSVGDIKARALFGPDGHGKTTHLDKLDLEELADRDVNRGFPGGEMKRPERV